MTVQPKKGSSPFRVAFDMNLKEILMHMSGKHGDAIEIDRVPSFWQHLTVRS
jgi:hypothetical protein